MAFDFSANTPIYYQIAQLIEIGIISGEYSPGERLPSVRDLALKLKVNPNTVQRSLTDLEDEGLIFTERTNGKFVTTDSSLINSRREKYASALAREYLESMRKIGFDSTDAIKHLKKQEE